LESAGAEREEGFGIGEEEACADFVLAGMEFAIPVGGELVVGVATGFADQILTGYVGRLVWIKVRLYAGNGRNEITVRVAKKVVLGLKKFQNNRINHACSDRRGGGAERVGNAGGVARSRQRGQAGIVDLRARRKGAALARALVIDEEKAELLVDHRAANAAAENVLLHRGTRLAGGVVEVFVGVEDVVSEEFVHIAMDFAGAAAQYGVDVAAAVASLGGVVKRSLDFELLDDIRIRQWDVVVLRNVVVGGAYALNQIVVVVLALSINEDFGGAAAQLGGSVEFAVSAGRESEKLLIILRGEWEIANGFLADGLAGSGIGGFNGSDLSRDFDFFGDRAGLERNREARGFGDAHLDVVGFGFGKTGLVDNHRVGARRKQSDQKGAVRAGI
jgi:hypothetical protein